MPESSPSQNSYTLPSFGLLILILLPSLGVFFAMAFEETRGTPSGQALYFAAKLLFYGIPVLYFFKTKRSKKFIWPVTKTHVISGITWGLDFALAMFLAILVCFYLGFDFQSLKVAAHENGLNHFWKYLFLALYLSFFNSFMEEFVWRDFIYRQFRSRFSKWVAIFTTGLAFTLHHFLALQLQFSTGFALIASCGVFAASCLWSILYLRHQNLWPAYISHIFADLVIFGFGAWLIFS